MRSTDTDYDITIIINKKYVIEDLQCTDLLNRQRLIWVRNRWIELSQEEFVAFDIQITAFLLNKKVTDYQLLSVLL